jgi:hypothetical protein
MTKGVWQLLAEAAYILRPFFYIINSFTSVVLARVQRFDALP